MSICDKFDCKTLCIISIIDTNKDNDKQTDKHSYRDDDHSILHVPGGDTPQEDGAPGPALTFRPGLCQRQVVSRVDNHVTNRRAAGIEQPVRLSLM